MKWWVWIIVGVGAAGGLWYVGRFVYAMYRLMTTGKQ